MAYTVIRVPFRFTNRFASKNRTAVVLSDRRLFHAPTSHSALAMITSATHSPWPLDCVLGRLAPADAAQVRAAHVALLPIGT